jgi:hypothetical protein
MITKLQRTRRERHAAPYAEIRNKYKNFDRKPVKRRALFEDLSADGRIILKWVFIRHRVWDGTIFISLRTDFIKGEEIPE